MNERIRELVEQASYNIIETDGAPIISSEFNKEKFAELIVKEAIGVVNKRYMGDNNREDFEVRRCVEDLKNHFGVK